MFRKLFLSSCTILGMIGTASAADLPSTKGPPVYAPAPPPAFSWSGFYIGGNVGYSWGHDHVADLDDYNGPPDIVFNPNGVSGGAQIGYNYQITPLVLVGFEAEGGYLGLHGSKQYGPFIGDPTRVGDSVAGVSGGAYGAFTGRLGLTFDRVLIYAKGGGVITGVGVSYVDPNPTGDTLASGTHGHLSSFSWTAGGGIEYAIDHNWSVKAEYDYYSLGSHTLYTFDPGGTEYRFRHENLYASEVKVGFNYRFDFAPPPAPVVAKY